MVGESRCDVVSNLDEALDAPGRHWHHGTGARRLHAIDVDLPAGCTGRQGIGFMERHCARHGLEQHNTAVGVDQHIIARPRNDTNADLSRQFFQDGVASVELVGRIAAAARQIENLSVAPLQVGEQTVHGRHRPADRHIRIVADFRDGLRPLVDRARHGARGRQNAATHGHVGWSRGEGPERRFEIGHQRGGRVAERRITDHLG